MEMTPDKYYEETIRTALDTMGIVLTTEQIEQLAGDVTVSAENFSMAFGHDNIPNPLISEMQHIKEQHLREIEFYNRDLDKTRSDLDKTRSALQDAHREIDRHSRTPPTR